MYNRRQIIELLNRLSYVVWEYWTHEGSRGRVLGWILRPDGGRDSVELFWSSACAWVVTSCPHHLDSIRERLGGSVSSVTLDYRVEAILGGEVNRYSLLQLPAPGGDGDAGRDQNAA